MAAAAVVTQEITATVIVTIEEEATVVVVAKGVGMTAPIGILTVATGGIAAARLLADTVRIGAVAGVTAVALRVVEVAQAVPIKEAADHFLFNQDGQTPEGPKDKQGPRSQR